MAQAMRDKERRPKAANPVESHACGLIWIGDTAERGAIERLQKEFDAIGGIDADFEVMGLRDFATVPCNRYGVPYLCRLYRSDWGKDNPHVQRDASMMEIAFDQTVLRKRVPVTWHCTADLFMRYEEDGDVVRPDYGSSYQYFSVMRYAELKRAGMLVDGDASREKSVVVLVEHRSGFVLPLPDHAVASWGYFGDGSGVEIAVYEGNSLRWQMDHYPDYFDMEEFLNEDTVELDILNCVDLLERLESGMVNPRSLTDAEVPECPYSGRDDTEQDNDGREDR